MSNWRFCPKCYRDVAYRWDTKGHMGEVYTRLWCATCGTVLEERLTTTASTSSVWVPS
jgi:transcription initiation factor TFIIIB Brf1 subunit/transcription initiation factor TFIIB